MSNKKIVFYSIINGVGSSTIGYQLARLLRIPFYQEQPDDLVYFLRKVLDSRKYTVKQYKEYDKEDEDLGGVFDVKHVDKELFRSSDAIIVLTNNSYLDVLKTIATLQKIESIIGTKRDIQIHVVFNRLQGGSNTSREKRYTTVSKDLINQHTNLDVKFSYIRTNLVYYRNIDKGSFFMDSFFKWNKEILEKFPTLLEMEPTKHLEMFFDAQYEKREYGFYGILEYEELFNYLMDNKYLYAKGYDTNTKIANLNFHQENIKNSRSAIKDMYSLLYKLGLYKKKYKVKENGIEITKIRKNIEEN